MDMTWRFYTGGNEIAALGSVGIGITILPGLKGRPSPAAPRPCECRETERP
jgi:hypothetical protein